MLMFEEWMFFWQKPSSSKWPFSPLWSPKLKRHLTCPVCPEWPGIMLWPVGERSLLSHRSPTCCASYPSFEREEMAQAPRSFRFLGWLPWCSGGTQLAWPLCPFPLVWIGFLVMKDWHGIGQFEVKQRNHQRQIYLFFVFCFFLNKDGFLVIEPFVCRLGV